jgi:hypothetical protein
VQQAQENYNPDDRKISTIGGNFKRLQVGSLTMPLKWNGSQYFQNISFLDPNVIKQSWASDESGHVILTQDAGYAQARLNVGSWGEYSFIASYGPNRGIADIYLDDHLVKTVDMNAPLYSDAPLTFKASPGNHTLKIVRTGRTTGTDKYIVLTSANSLQPTFQSSFRFSNSAIINFLGQYKQDPDLMVLSNVKGWDEALISSPSGNVSLIASFGPNRGIADVYIDGNFLKSIDMRAANYGLVTSRFTVASGNHHIRIVRSGKTTGTDSAIVLDSISGN